MLMLAAIMIWSSKSLTASPITVVYSTDIFAALHRTVDIMVDFCALHSNFFFLTWQAPTGKLPTGLHWPLTSTIVISDQLQLRTPFSRHEGLAFPDILFGHYSYLFQPPCRLRQVQGYFLGGN